MTFITLNLDLMKTIVLGFLCAVVTDLSAQNVGIGVTEPTTKLHVLGNILVTQPTFSTNSLPTPAQTFTMVNATTLMSTEADSTMFVYDPGGIAGSYSPGQTAYFVAYANTAASGYEITFSDMDLGTGDSLVIREYPASPYPAMFAVGNGYSTTGKIIINGWNFHLTFKSNADGNTGRGFAMKLKRLYTNYSQLPEMKSVVGSSMYYDVKKFAFRSGWTNNSAVGNYSFAAGWLPVATGTIAIALGENVQATNSNSISIGKSTISSGFSSIALGTQTRAVGNYSTAMGISTSAFGQGSTAMGNSTAADGENSVSMGHNNIASGLTSLVAGYNSSAVGSYSTAVGYNVYCSGATAFAIGNYAQATGSSSFALGNYVSTNGQHGSFVLGDNSTNSYMNSAVPNGFRARFAAGYGFYTSANLSTGVWLAAGGNSWMTISDRRLKENFLPVDGEYILKSIGLMPQYTWNYKTQDPKAFRHYGPMAQDFYNAFGKDELGTIGCDSMINQHDFLGVNFIAIQALVSRSDKLALENHALQKELGEMKKELQEIKKLLISKGEDKR
jgi:hypothetical protein